MDLYIVLLTGFGLLVLLTSWLPMLLKEAPLSLPIFCVAFGALVFGVVLPGTDVSPVAFPELYERLTEFVVVVALTGAGLKLDRPIGWRSWATTWRLLAIAMPLSILAMIAAASWLLGFSVAAALLLAAALAPTDPVLASDIQVGPPASGEEDEVRFTLTAEAGLNDALAFPFVHLAVALAAAASLFEADLWRGWLLEDVVWRLAAGFAMGWLVGKTLGWLTFRLPNRAKLSRTGDGLVALGIAFVAYGATELAHGYGFAAAFVAAVSFRSVRREHDFHETLHDFAEQIERLLLMIILVLFGGALAGGLLQALTWASVGFAALAIFVIRPLTGMVSLLGVRRPFHEKAIMSFFGIRGLGTIYYLGYALSKEEFPEAEQVWATAGLVILVSIVLHGTTVTPIMRRFDRTAEEDAAAERDGEGAVPDRG